MTIDLTRPLAWTAASPAERAMLENLQGNILKGHGRDYVTLLFVRFRPGTAVGARAFLRQLVTDHVHDAWTQLDQARRFKATRQPGDVFVGVGLSAAGYRLLGIPDGRVPAGAAFRKGMKTRALGDPVPGRWEAGYRGVVHVLVLIGDDLQARVDGVRHRIETALADRQAGTVVAREDGHTLRNMHNDGVEHFGYVDGRSQPLMLTEDVERERKDGGGIDAWSPAFGPDLALVPDPGDPGPSSFGSYLVFRKLEQNVRGFKAAEARLARKLGLAGSAAARAGALIVGRFRDGTPVVLQDHDGLLPVTNNFGITGDAGGGKCPFHAHTRKTNPRGDTAALGATLEQERAHLMPRRGIPFGQRATHPTDPALAEHPQLAPTRGVGLLFMAYNADLERQFEFTQISWANDPQFAGKTGLDPVIGQGRNPRGFAKWPRIWGQAKSTPATGLDIAGFVRMKGGEYFFAPSLRFLRTL